MSFVEFKKHYKEEMLLQMTDDKIRNLKIQLKLGLGALEEALRFAEMYSHDLRCFNLILAVRDDIQEVLGSVRTKFPSIEGLFEDDDAKLVLQQSNIRSGPESGRFFQSPNMGVNLSGELLNCRICKVNCSNLSQWRQHVKGKQHQARLVIEDPTKRTKFTYMSKRKNIFSVKLGKKEGKFCQRRNEKAECHPPKGRRWKLKDAEMLKRWLHGRRHNGSQMWCKLCDVTCNGNLQYLGHINGKRHQMAVELCQRVGRK